MARTVIRAAADGVGRGGELARLLELSAAARHGAAPPVLITGPAVVGKSELIDRLWRRAAREGAVVVRAVAPDRELTRPGGLLERCLAAARAAGASVPEGRTAATDAADTVVLAAFEQLEAHGPVLFVADDLHRADPESLAVLRRLLRGLHPLAVLAVLSGHDRPDGWLEPPPGDAWPEETVRIRLTGLSMAEVDTLAREVDPDVSAWVVRRLREETAGNPLYLRAVLADGDLTARYRLGRPRPPGSIVAGLRRRLTRLPESARATLEALSVLGEPAPVRAVAALTGVATTLADCAPLVEEGLLEAQVDETDELLGFGSTLTRDAVYGSIAAPRRRALHRRAAELTDGAAHWRHRVGSTTGADAGLAADLEHAAATEIRRGQLVTAAEYLLWASARSADPTGGADRLTGAVRLLMYAAREGDALQHTGAVEALPDSPARSEVLGLLAFARDEVVVAQDLLQRAHDELDGRGTDETTGRLDLELAYVCLVLRAGDGAAEAAARALDRVPGRPRLAALAHAFLAAGTALTDGAEAGLDHLAFLPAAPARAAPHQLAALTQRGILRGLLGRLSPASEDLGAVARRRGTPLAHLLGVSAQVHLVWCSYLLGEWDAARRHLGSALESSTRHGRAVERAALASLSAIVHAGRGELEVARRERDRALALAESGDLPGPEIPLAIAGAAIAQADGRPDDVRTLLGPLTGTPALYAGWWLPSLIDSQLDTGRSDDAARSLEALAEVPATGSCLPVARAWLDGRLAAARRDPERALRLFEDGLALRGDGGEPVWYRTRLLQAYGVTLLRVGRVEAGRAALDRAASTYARLGARPFLERCRAEAAGLDPGPRLTAAPVVPGPREGSRPPRPDGGVTARRWADELTDREREVTVLVGRGWTNPEIAAELFVSAKTVEYHLRNVYLKLGLPGRRALRDHVQRT